jgi:hypothetical protein
MSLDFREMQVTKVKWGKEVGEQKFTHRGATLLWKTVVSFLNLKHTPTI